MGTGLEERDGTKLRKPITKADPKNVDPYLNGLKGWESTKGGKPKDPNFMDLHLTGMGREEGDERTQTEETKGPKWTFP